MPLVLILLLFTLAYLIQAAVLPLGSMKTVGPGLYPVVISVIMLLLLLVQLYREYRKPSAVLFRVSKYQLICLVLLGSLIFLLEKIGYLAVALVFCFAFSLLLGWQLRTWHPEESRWKVFFFWPLFATLSIAGADYLLFELAFDFHLP